MVDLIELYTHWWAGRSKHELAASLGLDRKTVRKYLAPAEAAGMVPGSREVDAARWAQLAAEWFPQVANARLRQITWGQFDEHADFIRGQIKAGVRAAVIYQRLVDAHGVKASQRSLNRWIAATISFDELSEATIEARATVRMPAPVPGALAEVDYGLLGPWTDPDTGRRHRVQGFIMTLPYSKMVFCYPVTRMRQEDWTSAHIAAFEFFGAVPQIVRSDNLKTGVVKPDLYDPRLNRSYRELGEYYGVVLDPARAAHPKDKPHVERSVQYVRGSFWVGQVFTSMAQMRAEAARWSYRVAGRRRVRELGQLTPIQVLDSVERPVMRALPPVRFEVATWTRAKVAPDCHVSVGGVLYSIPYRLIGQHLEVRLTALRAEFYHGGDLVKTHPRKARGRVSDLEDYPPKRAAYLSRDAAWCRKRAADIGPACAGVVERLMEVNALARLRSCQGIVSLAGKDHADAARLEAACVVALDVGDPSYRTVKNLFTHPPAAMAPLPQGDNGAGGILRGPAAFTD